MKRTGQGRKDFKVVRHTKDGQVIPSMPLTINQAVEAKLKLDRMDFANVEIVKFK